MTKCLFSFSIFLLLSLLLSSSSSEFDFSVLFFFNERQKHHHLNNNNSNGSNNGINNSIQQQQKIKQKRELEITSNKNWLLSLYRFQKCVRVERVFWDFGGWFLNVLPFIVAVVDVVVVVVVVRNWNPKSCFPSLSLPFLCEFVYFFIVRAAVAHQFPLISHKQLLLLPSKRNWTIFILSEFFYTIFLTLAKFQHFRVFFIFRWILYLRFFVKVCNLISFFIYSTCDRPIN